VLPLYIYIYIYIYIYQPLHGVARAISVLSNTSAISNRAPFTQPQKSRTVRDPVTTGENHPPLLAGPDCL